MTEKHEEQKHTPEPWAYDPPMDDNQYAIEAERVIGANGDPVIELEDDYPGYPESGEHLILKMSRANADRMLACVNGCKGINPEAVIDMYNSLTEIMEDTLGGKFSHDFKWDRARKALDRAKK